MKKSKFLASLLLSATAIAFLAGCAPAEVAEEPPVDPDPVVTDEVVNIYSARHYDVDKGIYDTFYAETGIKVNIIEGTAAELLERIKREGADTEADLFITADIANLYQAVAADLVDPVMSDMVDANVPANLRGENNEWIGLTKRARIIAYDKETITPDMLSTYDALTDAEFAGKILVRGSSSSYNQSLLASFIAENGEEAATEWAAGIVANMAREPKGNDRDQVKAIAAGEGEIAILNTYYLGRMQNSDDLEEVAAFEAVGVFFPEVTHVNISGAVLIKDSENKDNAVKLLEYLTGEVVQKLYTDENYEYPVNAAVTPADILVEFGEFTEQDISITDVGVHNAKATEIFGIVGWK